MSKIVNMKNIIKKAREEKGLLMRDVAQKLNIDAALISKWEKGTRKPTRDQVIKLASLLGLDTEKLLIEWMSEVILYEIGYDDLALKAMKIAEEKVRYGLEKSNIKLGKSVITLLKEIDVEKNKLIKLRYLDSYRIAQALELEYTFESNRIEGNTLTLKETDLVINEGITISGKSMREHLEAINHQDAVLFLKDLVDKNIELKERDLLQLHNLVLRGIDAENAGKYRTVQVMIKGSQHMPPPPFLVAKQMEDIFLWYQLNKNKLHPVVLAAEMSEKIVTIHPFIDGNGRTSRLWMNLILLKHGYVIANIKGDHSNRLCYYDALEMARVDIKKNSFIEFIAKVELEALKRYLNILGA
jgi:fido (protein-threonine AMPylation protein)/DNA-binding XRE family transcriptional regulator